MAYTKKDWVSGELITEAALDNMENGIKNNDTAITAHAGDIATVETTNRASRAYSIGEFLLYNNRLYIVTAAIASGGTITVGTNVSATSVGDQLETLNNNLTNTRALIMGGLLPDGTDLNDVVTPGYYTLPSSRTYTNTPGTVYSLAVYRSSANSDAVLQVAWHTHSLYFRFRTTATTWQSNWRVVESNAVS